MKRLKLIYKNLIPMLGISNYFILKDDPENTSLLLITKKNGYFIKFRCTFFDEPFMREISKNYVQTFFSEILSDSQHKIYIEELLPKLQQIEFNGSYSFYDFVNCTRCLKKEE